MLSSRIEFADTGDLGAWRQSLEMRVRFKQRHIARS
jgi:hypothetical protein